jgi:hypothetical protein
MLLGLLIKQAKFFQAFHIMKMDNLIKLFVPRLKENYYIVLDKKLNIGIAK